MEERRGIQKLTFGIKGEIIYATFRFSFLPNHIILFGSPLSQYGDSTCSVGFSEAERDTHKCFNTAKIFEIEWYNHHVASI